MSERFTKKWENKRDEPSFVDTIRGTVKQQQPLKPRLDYAIKKLDFQISRLDQANEKFAQKDKALFAKLVDAYTKHDTARANIYANELAEVRKMARLTMNARLALDQVALRIKTVTEFGDIITHTGASHRRSSQRKRWNVRRPARSRKRTRRNRQHTQRRNVRRRLRLRNDPQL